MAIIPGSSYPGKINAPTTAYPLGSAKNVSAPSAGDGTPLLANWLNDMWGFYQKLLAEGGVTASGNPDTALASQYFDAMHNYMIEKIAEDKASNSNILQSFAGRGNANGSALYLPAGWTSSRIGHGNMRVVHNLNLSNYAVHLQAHQFNVNAQLQEANFGPNSFDFIIQVHNSDQRADTPWHFHLDVIKI